ncbi:MAG TPA: hypothetical protein VFZ38_15020 [Vicinamibacterales bacterium]
MKRIAGLCSAVAISTVGLLASTSAEATLDDQGREEVHAVGCVRAWKPAPQDVTRLPENREPGMSGIYVLTPLASGPTVATDLPTYLLTPSATVNFHQHLDRKVEVVGMAQIAPMPPTVQEIVSAPTERPEEKPNAQSFPRLTVKTIRRVADSCPS